MYTVDESLPDTLETYLFCLFEVMSTLFVVSAVTPIFTLFLFPIIFIYYKQQNYFTTSYRDLKRLDSVLRSPIIALFGETLDGVTTIRAFEAERSFMSRMMKMLDDQQHAYFLTLAAQSWLGVRLELLGTGIILVACLAAILDHDAERGNQYFAGLAGLSISYAISVTQSLNWTVRVGSDLEANMVCVERLVEYCSLESEASVHTDYDTKLSKLWPGKGEIEFQNVKLRYRPGLPLVLNDLNLKIPAQSTVGIVGRTGAGNCFWQLKIFKKCTLSL
jgi:ATP-binding cassette, subfamily C (CFTR/MRP), member 1